MGSEIPEASRGGVAPPPEELLLRKPGADGVLHLVMNRPEKRNALNGALVEALTRALDETAEDPDVRVLVLRGRGPDFCSGADLAELEALAGQGVEASLSDASRMGRLFVAMRRHPRPIVAAVHGKALAGGCGLATACDLIVAHEDARLGFPEVRLGFVPAMVMTLLRRKVAEGHAFEMVTLGKAIGAAEAHRIGLVNQVWSEEDFEEELTKLSGELASRPPSAIELTKRLLYGLDGLSVEEGIGRGAEVNTLARLTEACQEGVRAFLERKRRS
jgi:methylglutaconyl-CoA hydratase